MRCHQLSGSVLSVLAAAPLANFATPLAPPWDDIRVKHTWNAVPPNWETLGHPPASTTIDLYVALKPHHENALINALYEVSEPSSPKYGAHLSKEQAAQLVAPHPETLELINSWLEHRGVPSSSISTTQGGSWLTLTGVPVSQANDLLGASYQFYRPTGTNDTAILRTISYALPAVLHTHVQTVVPTTHFASTHTPWQTLRSRSESGGASADMASRELVTVLSSRNRFMVAPSYLRWLYRTSAYVPAATDQNVLGISCFMNDYPSPADLTKFMTEYRADAVSATFSVEQINGGGFDPSHPTKEANVNIQYAQVIAYPTPHIFYSTGGSEILLDGNKAAANDPWLQWLNYVLSQPNVPQTISTPFCAPEKALPLEYTTALCNLYAQLGARGASVLFSSGNYGVGRGDCLVTENDGSKRVQFATVFPASCPWVTSVGGTVGYPEVAASLSGGGFSNHFPRPRYQESVVPAYLGHLDNQYEGLYNRTGRGVPDIAAQAVNYLTVVSNRYFSVKGTSCSTPTVAGIISLLNDYLLSTGKAPLGFLNPWLYGKGLLGLNDITSGSNPGCGTAGFSAIAGWDPVTGLGTPDFLDLRDTLPRVTSMTTTTPTPTPTAPMLPLSSTLPT